MDLTIAFYFIRGFNFYLYTFKSVISHQNNFVLVVMFITREQSPRTMQYESYCYLPYITIVRHIYKYAATIYKL